MRWTKSRRRDGRESAARAKAEQELASGVTSSRACSTPPAACRRPPRARRARCSRWCRCSDCRESRSTISSTASRWISHRTATRRFDELLGYCRRVASAVGLVCIEIFGCRDRAARDYAIDLGIALQLTNIVRDVGVDLKRGRVYLPQEDLRRFNCTEDDLRRGVVTDSVRALLTFEIARARP